MPKSSLMSNQIKNWLFLVFWGFQGYLLSAQDVQNPATQRLKVEGYGAVNYYHYNWETYPTKRDAFDPERLNMYLYYQFSDKIQFKSEIEFEHGGTGSTMSFDPLEEFGEFEAEVEKGGQVVAEQINLQFLLHPSFKIRAGKMRFYMGNASKQDQPREYFTAHRSEIENTLLPLGWYETGLEISGDFHLKPSEYPMLSYKLYAVTGLDNTGFNSLNWIRKGYQTRFETINANSLAYAARLDYIFAKDCELGFCFYANNASPNRPKNDFSESSWVIYGDVHFAWENQKWRTRAYGMAGNIQNSDALSAANRNLSNNLNVKRTPVGKMAAGAYAEVAYNIMPKDHPYPFFVFSRWEWYDAMFKTAGNVSDNPRYERKIITAGINFFAHPKVVVKAHYNFKTLGTGDREDTFVAGIGFDF